MIASSAGSRIALRDSASIRPWQRLLMSSEVQAKWMNWLLPPTSGLVSKRSRIQYSTALTS